MSITLAAFLSQSELSKLSRADIEALKNQLAVAGAALTEHESNAARRMDNEVALVVRSFGSQLREITGRDYSAAEVVNLVKQVDSGKLGTLGAIGTNEVTHERREQIKALLVERFAILRANDPTKQPPQLSDIARQVGVFVGAVVMLANELKLTSHDAINTLAA